MDSIFPLLIVAATEAEIGQTRQFSAEKKLPVDFCITGPGIPATVYYLTRKLAHDTPRMTIHAGIAGSFNSRLSIGQVVEVTEDCFADMGAEDGENFLHISTLALAVKDPEFTRTFFSAPGNLILETGLPRVKGITVNSVHGHEPSIQRVMAQFHPDVESMEGAAVFYVCRLFNVPCLQIRSISNRIEKRDTRQWEKEKAMDALNHFLIEFLIKKNSSLQADGS
jgi:futalosine hydrolase